MNQTFDVDTSSATSPAAPPLATLPQMPISVLGDLAAYGLAQDAEAQILELAARIDPANPMSVSDFGGDVADHASRYADELLAEVRNSDLADAGKKLSAVVSVANELSLHALSDKRSRMPVIGPLIDRVRKTGLDVVGRFESTKAQIDRLVDDVDQVQSGLAKRNVGLETMFGAVTDEYRMLGVHAAAGKLALAGLQAKADAASPSATTPEEVQALADLRAMIANLEIRVSNLLAQQQSALQTLPQIRMVQRGNELLVEKFWTVKRVTVPAWKRQFMLALGLNEQRNAVDLADTIDDATNELLRRNAELLRQNSVATAKANQRLVIDVRTLQQVQDTMIRTVEEVLVVQRAGVAERRKAEREIAAMRVELTRRIARSQAVEVSP